MRPAALSSPCIALVVACAGLVTPVRAEELPLRCQDDEKTPALQMFCWAMYKIDAGDWQRAVELLQTAIADPTQPEAGALANRYGKLTAERYFPYYWLGFCHVKRTDRDRDCASALEAFETSLARDRLAEKKRKKLNALKSQCAS